jgi:hypothetical protein
MSKTKQEEVKQKEVKKEVFTDIVFYKGGTYLMDCFSDYPQWLREWLDEINRTGKVSYTEVLSGSGHRVKKLVIETNGIKQDTVLLVHIGGSTEPFRYRFTSSATCCTNGSKRILP